jgi:hypothetical protein
MLQGGKQMHDTMISHDQIRATTVKGTDVYSAAGEHLGHIDDIVLNKVDGRATIAIMSFGGFLGMGESFHPLPWQGLSYDPARGGYIVNVSREQLEGAPTYREGDEPDWNDPVYGDRLRGYYGYPLI